MQSADNNTEHCVSYISLVISNTYLAMHGYVNVKNSQTVGISAFPSVNLSIPHHIGSKESINRNYKTKQIITQKFFKINYLSFSLVVKNFLNIWNYSHSTSSLYSLQQNPFAINKYFGLKLDLTHRLTCRYRLICKTWLPVGNQITVSVLSKFMTCYLKLIQCNRSKNSG